MEAIVYTVFAIFAVFGIYTAAREAVILITRLCGKEERHSDLCEGCGICRMAEKKDKAEFEDTEKKEDVKPD